MPRVTKTSLLEQLRAATARITEIAAERDVAQSAVALLKTEAEAREEYVAKLIARGQALRAELDALKATPAKPTASRVHPVAPREPREPEAWLVERRELIARAKEAIAAGKRATIVNGEVRIW